MEKMNKKQKNVKEVAYLRKISEEAKKVNKKLEDDLRKIIRSGESLSNYELWLNKKCDIMIKIDYLIETYIKDFEKEKTIQVPYKNNELVYVLVKKNIESEE